jgi:hypothetical protein
LIRAVVLDIGSALEVIDDSGEVTGAVRCAVWSQTAEIGVEMLRFGTKPQQK